MPIPGLSKPDSHHAHESHDSHGGPAPRSLARTIAIALACIAVLAALTLGTAYAAPFFDLWKLRRDLPSLTRQFFTALSTDSGTDVRDAYEALHTRIHQGSSSYSRFADALPPSVLMRTGLGKNIIAGDLLLATADQTLIDAQPLLPLMQEGIALSHLSPTSTALAAAHLRFSEELARQSGPLRRVRRDLEQLAEAARAFPSSFAPRILRQEPLAETINRMTDAANTNSLLPLFMQLVNQNSL